MGDSKVVIDWMIKRREHRCIGQKGMILHEAELRDRFQLAQFHHIYKEQKQEADRGYPSKCAVASKFFVNFIFSRGGWGCFPSKDDSYLSQVHICLIIWMTLGSSWDFLCHLLWQLPRGWMGRSMMPFKASLYLFHFK